MVLAPKAKGDRQSIPRTRFAILREAGNGETARKRKSSPDSEMNSRFTTALRATCHFSAGLSGVAWEPSSLVGKSAIADRDHSTPGIPAAVESPLVYVKTAESRVNVAGLKYPPVRRRVSIAGLENGAQATLCGAGRFDNRSTQKERQFGTLPPNCPLHRRAAGKLRGNGAEIPESEAVAPTPAIRPQGADRAHGCSVRRKRIQRRARLPPGH